MMAMADKETPLGEPLDLTDAQLDEASIITPMDIEKARQRWRNTAPVKFKTLLDAQTVEDEGNP